MRGRRSNASLKVIRAGLARIAHRLRTVCAANCDAVLNAVVDADGRLMRQCLEDEICVNGTSDEDATCECASPTCVPGEAISCDNGLRCVCGQEAGRECGGEQCSVDAQCGDICPYITCDDPWLGHCYSQTILISPIVPGACSNSSCSYQSESINCEAFQQNGKCVAGECVDACIGVVCPPVDDQCWDQHTLFHYDAGTCEGWEANCTYERQIISCPNGCTNGACN